MSKLNRRDLKKLLTEWKNIICEEKRRPSIKEYQSYGLLLVNNDIIEIKPIIPFKIEVEKSNILHVAKMLVEDIISGRVKLTQRYAPSNENFREYKEYVGIRHTSYNRELQDYLRFYNHNFLDFLNAVREDYEEVNPRRMNNFSEEFIVKKLRKLVLSMFNDFNLKIKDKEYLKGRPINELDNFFHRCLDEINLIIRYPEDHEFFEPIRGELREFLLNNIINGFIPIIVE